MVANSRWNSRRVQGVAIVALAGLIAIAGCSSGDNGTSNAEQPRGSVSGSPGGTLQPRSKEPIIIGTTDKVVALDPAGSYDQGSLTLKTNLYQTLLRIPPGKTTPVAGAAHCQFSSPLMYKCTLNHKARFSNGDPVTAKDVAFSFQRMVEIKSPQGPWTLLAPMESVEAHGKDEVVFKLKQPDYAWPFVLTSVAGYIVDSKVFPRNRLLEDSKVIGSGPYRLKNYQPGSLATLVPNSEYRGPQRPRNSLVIVKYEKQSSTLKLDLEQKNIDVAFRTLSPLDLKSLKDESSRGIKIVSVPGTEERYIVFNFRAMPGGNSKQKLAIRKSIAYMIDRGAIAETVYSGAVKPLYSMVPDSIDGSVPAYKNLYGTSPDKRAAARVLKEAGVQTPVSITLWWTPSHYGPLSGDAFQTIQRKLTASGLFHVRLESAEWAQFSSAAFTDQYGIFQLGAYPDFPDPDNFLAPLFYKGGFLANHYNNPTVNKLITKEQSEQNREKRLKIIQHVQRLIAQDLPTIPLWQGNEVAAVGSDVEGVRDAFMPTLALRFWTLHKSGG